MIDPSKTPRSSTHVAYYAMFHAASGVVAAVGKRTVKTHSGLSTLFNKVIHERAPGHLELVAELTRAFNARLLVDYDDGGDDPVGRAVVLTSRAPAYVEACKKLVAGLLI